MDGKKRGKGAAAEKLRASFKSRTFRVGGYSVAAAAVVIAIAVALNLLVAQLPSTATQLDLTSTDLYTLSDQTKEIVSGMDRDTTVYWVVTSGNEDSYLEKLLERYSDLSDKITVTKVDPVVYPNFAAKYTDEQVSDNSLIVVCGDRSYYVAASDLYDYDYSNYYYDGTYTTSFDGESNLTSALDYVLSDSLPKLYILGGHGEESLSSSVQTLVKQQNFETADLSLLTVDAVPEDADAVLLYGPSTDLSEDETAKLKTYLDNGGNLLLLTGYSTAGTALPNLVSLMENYGVTSSNSLVVETDSTRYFTGYTYFLLPNEESHTITSPLISDGYYVLAPYATGITQLSDVPDNVTVTPLLTTSDGAYAKADIAEGATLEQTDGDAEGPFDIGVALEVTADSGDTGHIVWLSSSMMLDDNVDSAVSGGNSDLFVNALGWMCERESAVSIHAKSLDSASLTVSAASASVMSFITIGLLPLGALAAGIYITVRRRRG